MKRFTIITIIFLIFINISFSQEKKVAVLVPYDKEKKISDMYELMIRTTLTREISNATGYIALDMANVDAVIDQIRFQNTGLVRDNERQELGNRYGAEYICRSELLSDNGYITISASIIEIETGQVVPGKTDFVLTQLNPTDIEKACKELSEKLFGLNNGNNNNNNSETFTDNRDGKTYKIVTIGNQIWMAENLAYKANSGCWAYNDNQSNITKYGYLYNWETANKVCPDGWHLPTKNEYEILLNNYGGNNDSEANFIALMPNGKSGFCVLPGGWRVKNGNFYRKDDYANFWSTSINNSLAHSIFVDYYHKKAYAHNSEMTQGYSVRCIKGKNTQSIEDYYHN